MQRTWKITLLGDFNAVSEQHRLRFRTQKARALLAYLSYYPGRSHSREILAEMFWPDSEPKAARLNLRAELCCLRRQLERSPSEQGAVLISDHASVQLNTCAIQTDVALFEYAIQSAASGHGGPDKVAALRRASDLYSGRLLPGFYDEWLLPEQERLNDLYRSALQQLSGLLREQGETEEAIRVAHLSVAADPLCEPACVDLIALYVTAGRPADALRQYRLLEQRLEETLGIAPSPETRRLLEGVLPAPGSARSCGSLAPAVSVTGAEEAGSGATPTAIPSQAHLPNPLSRFIGREQEIAMLKELLAVGVSAPSRLVTLTGPAGSGKTRLAIEAARLLRPEYESSVWFVSLADLPPDGSLLESVLEPLRLPPAPEMDRIDQAASSLDSRAVLIVLDNFEHLADANRDTLYALLRRTEKARFLVTSRHRLGGIDEQEVPVLPLRIPEPEESDLEAILACESVQMFQDRVRMARPDFRVSQANALDCAAICRRLDGLPLGIDLVGGWSSLLTPAQIAVHLEKSEMLLARRTAALPARHASLRAAIDWSWQLLDEPLRAFVAQLSVFRASWSLEAAQSICRTGRALERIAVLQDRSLVLSEGASEMRFRMLESIRAFAEEQLPAEERELLRQRHAEYYLTLAEAQEREPTGRAEGFRADQGNMMAALSHLQGREEGVRLAASLSSFWVREGKLEEAQRCLTQALQAAPSAAPQWRGKALLAGAVIASVRGDVGLSEAMRTEGARVCAGLCSEAEIVVALRPLAAPVLLERGMGSTENTGAVEDLLSRGRGDPYIRAFLLGWQGKRAHFAGNRREAQERFDESLALYRDLSEPQGTAALLYLRGEEAVYRIDWTEAHRLWQQCLAVHRELEHKSGVVMATTSLAYLARRRHDYEGAQALAEEVTALSRRFGLRCSLATALWLLGTVALNRGEHERAANLLEESLSIHRSQGNAWGIADALSALAMVANNQADYPRARSLFGEALELRRKGLDNLDIAVSLGDMGLVALCEGDHGEAKSLLRESLDRLQDLQDHVLKARVLTRMGLAACRSGETDHAESCLRAGMALLSGRADALAVAEGLEGLAELRIQQQFHSVAALLSGSSASIRSRIGAPLPPRELLRRASQTIVLERAMGSEALESCIKAGAAMNCEQAIACGLEQQDLLNTRRLPGRRPRAMT